MKKTIGFTFETECAQVTIEAEASGFQYAEEIQNLVIFNETKTDEELASIVFGQYSSVLKIKITGKFSFVQYER